MTGGSNHDGRGGEGAGGNNRHPLPPRDDRETLSALFDGELPSDAARFAIKRLDHDLAWRETCGRWQLIGDALRGEDLALAAPGLAAHVARRLGQSSEEEAQVMAATAARSQAVTPRRGWMVGTALAASVVLAAVLVVRPFSGPQTSAPPAVVEARPAAPLPAGPSTALPAGGEANPAPVRLAAVTPAPAVRSERTRRPVSRIQRERAASGDATPAGTSAATVVASVAQEAVRQPFHPPADEIVTRPWPRAAMPEVRASGGLTVGLGGTSAAPSVDPFEPRPADVPPGSPDPVPDTQP